MATATSAPSQPSKPTRTGPASGPKNSWKSAAVSAGFSASVATLVVEDPDARAVAGGLEAAQQIGDRRVAAAAAPEGRDHGGHAQRRGVDEGRGVAAQGDRPLGHRLRLAGGQHDAQRPGVGAAGEPSPHPRGQ